MSKHIFKRKKLFVHRGKGAFLVFFTVFLLVFIGIITAGFFSPVVRSGLHRIAVLSGLSDPVENAEIPISAEKIFTDVSSAHPQAKVLAELKKRGFIKGHSDGSFKPDEKMNRAETIAMLVVFKGIEPNRINFANCFKDVGQEWFANSICYAKSKQWVSGYPDGTFRPSAYVTGLEVQKIFSTAIGVSTSALSNIEKEQLVTRVEFAGLIYSNVQK